MLYYLISGERMMFIQGRTYRIKKGSLVFINKYDLYNTADTEAYSYERVQIRFNDEFVRNLTCEDRSAELLRPFHCAAKVLPINIHDQGKVEHLLFAMLHEQNSRSPNSDIMIHALMLQLFILCSRLQDNCSTNSRVIDSPTQRKIFDIADDISLHFAQPMTLTALSEKFHLSAPYLSRMFKQVTGFKVMEYVNHVRVREARRLLRETKLKVTEVAEHTGYDSIVHFGRVFKQVTGISPLSYRKSNQ
jgi:YesN/AraC family two-component response regulator